MVVGGYVQPPIGTPTSCSYLLPLGLVVGIRGYWHFGGGLGDIGLLVAILPRMAFEDGPRSTIGMSPDSQYPLRIVSGGHFAGSPVDRNTWDIINKMGANTDYGIVPYKQTAILSNSGNQSISPLSGETQWSSKKWFIGIVRDCALPVCGYCQTLAALSGVLVTALAFCPGERFAFPCRLILSQNGATEEQSLVGRKETEYTRPKLVFLAIFRRTAS